MTLPSTPRRAGPFNGNDSATSFPFEFKVFSDEDILVVRTSSTGVETTLTLDSDYSVTLNGDQDDDPGGAITYPLSGSPLATGQKLTIAGALEYDQPTDIPDGGNFSPTALENALDRIEMQIQQLAEESIRSIRLALSSGSGVSAVLPPPEANRLLAWNSTATGLTNRDTPLTTDLVSADNVEYDPGHTGSEVGNVQRKLREFSVSITDFVESDVDLGDNTTDIYTAASTAISCCVAAGGGEVWFPEPTVAYRLGTTLQGADGVRLAGPGVPNRWRALRSGVRVNYVGAGAAVAVTPAAAAGIDSFQIEGLEFDGRSASAGAHGLYLNATAASSYIEGIYVANAVFQNFPGNQVRHDGTVFDTTYRRVGMLNPDRAALDCCLIQNGQPSQITFDDCWIMPYTVAKWGVYCSGADDLRFIAGSVVPYNDGTATGANGVFAAGGLYIYGTHFEGVYDTQTASKGIQYVGSNGAFISPSLCALFGTGVEIGDGSSTAARGWVIAGNIGNNNVSAGGVADIIITAGGDRTGTILSTGFANGTPTVINNRLDVDGVDDVGYMHLGRYQGHVQARAGTAATPGLAVGSSRNQGLYDVGGNVLGVAAGGVQVAQVRSTDWRMVKRFLPSTPTGAAQADAGIYACTGAPDNADGANGDIVVRSDGGSLTTIYHKRGGAWVGVV